MRPPLSSLPGWPAHAKPCEISQRCYDEPCLGTLVAKKSYQGRRIVGNPWTNCNLQAPTCSYLLNLRLHVSCSMLPSSTAYSVARLHEATLHESIRARCLLILRNAVKGSMLSRSICSGLAMLPNNALHSSRRSASSLLCCLLMSYCDRSAVLHCIICINKLTSTSLHTIVFTSCYSATVLQLMICGIAAGCSSLFIDGTSYFVPNRRFMYRRFALRMPGMSLEPLPCPNQ